MNNLRNPTFVLGLIIVAALVSPVAAFGAGNIASVSKLEGQNWRHGDIEDALLTLAMARAMKHKKFSKIMVSRVYFGNWLRDYSQAIDVGTVKSVSAEAIRLLLCILGFLTFGYGSGEFEVTADRLGCYRPEDHIDNPKNYADNQDARQYDRRLRGPIDEDRELSIDPQSGMKNYIANERAGIMTSAKHVRNLFTRCVELGRNYKNNERKEDLYESLRLMGTGLHCLEDFLAHSNYCELALVEMGERDVFPHVGRNTLIRLDGADHEVYPIVTGTFGGVDFLHSVVGEVSDKMSQNEIEELEGTLQESKNSDTSLLRDLLDKIPDSLFGGKNQKNRIDEIQENAASAQVENMSVSPRNPEELTVYVQQVYRQIMPAIQFHDDVMKSITSAVEKIPVLPKIIEQLEDQLSKFVFSVMAPAVVPLIRQIKNELATGSGEVIQSSKEEQHVVFNNDQSTDPTHSMLSKDHFSNILNEIAGRTAARMVSWVVPQIMDAIDDDSVDVNRLCDRIINGILHHPAQRNMGHDGVSEARNLMFDEVRTWWGELQNEHTSYREKLCREGVLRGENHKEGVDDTGHGHGCTGKLQMRKLYGEPDTLENRIAGAAAGAIIQGATGLISNVVEQQTGMKLPSGQGSQQNEQPGEEKSGLEGFLSKASSLLGGALGKDDEGKRYTRNDGESFTGSQTSHGYQGTSYGQSQQSSHYSGGSSEFHRREDSEYGARQESSYGGGGGGGGYVRQESGHGGSSQHHHPRRQEESSYDDPGSAYGGREGFRHGGYGGRDEGYERDTSYGRREGSGPGRQESSYGQDEGSYGRREGHYGAGSQRHGGQVEYVSQESRHGGRGREQDDEDDEDEDGKNHGRSSSYGRRGGGRCDGEDDEEDGEDDNDGSYGRRGGGRHDREDDEEDGEDDGDGSHGRRGQGGYGY
ncbi:uncharacterized protein UV8b_04202 [Ustilaginoidea virens]|uniref:Uncharacterized protein n=1 Tax=Ustilaginoidea virens TaxID=1159556 RepID=A0A063C2S4_USTVR|nr:uncharacterized protein UV8b_04202 [Ustilaginoidea virens]QUC19961.1 hypothetical protein UV8b_04202 [Ustilaginoidea virens]GAO15244.1 hypothetical protein UVI_02006670 [Ustilaginoidea virens]